MNLLDQLWDGYAAQVPYAKTFVELAGGDFRNDHVAFRSLDLEPVARLFESLGWARAGSYDLPDVHLNAIHLSKPGQPRVFVSELRVNDLSPRARELLARLPEAPPARAEPGWFAAPELRFSFAELQELERESQYAAWLCLFGREVNHFTASVDDIEGWARRMRGAGVPMKGEIEGEPGAPLRQTATKAAPRRIAALDRDWPYAYLELAERQPGFDGFVTAQARQLFDMTRR